MPTATESLTRKLGPLPVWAWGVGVAAVVIGGRILTGRSATPQVVTGLPVVSNPAPGGGGSDLPGGDNSTGGDEFTADLAALRAQIDTQQSDIASLSSQYTDLDSRYTTLGSDYSDLYGEIQGVTSQFQSADEGLLAQLATLQNLVTTSASAQSAAFIKARDLMAKLSAFISQRSSIMEKLDSERDQYYYYTALWRNTTDPTNRATYDAERKKHLAAQSTLLAQFEAYNKRIGELNAELQAITP